MDETGLLARLRGLLGDRAGVAEQQMVGGRSFSLDGQMFCGARKDGLMVRVGPDAAEEAARQPGVSRMTMGSKQVAAFVVVSPETITGDDELRTWVQRGLDAVRPSESADRFADLVAAMSRFDDVDPPGPGGSAFGAGALKTGRSIFAMLSQDRLVVKLPRARVEELIGTGEGEPFTAGKQRPMREWVTVVSEEPSTWRVLAEEARSFVRGG